MRFIAKRDSPQELEDWKEQEQPDHWTALHGSLPPEEDQEEGIVYYSKIQLLATLIDEQRGLCAYCNRRIEASLRPPIDHVDPREGDTQTDRIFDYTNLVASCDGNQHDRTKPAKRHCDPCKGASELPITPLQTDCNSRIRFADNGQVINPDDDPEVSATIGVLNLNLPKLANARAAAIAGEVFVDVEQTELLNAGDARIRLLQLRALENGGDLLPEWFSAVVSVLERLGGVV